MSHEDQVYELKTAEFAADGDECVRRDDAARIARAADAEIARLQSGIAALREQWQARQDAWLTEFDEEMQKAARAERSLILAGQRYAMACVLEELDALFPPDTSA